ncbi:MAG TPA: hypothetical protein VKZ96_01905 [Thermomicrobiales bacterium]|nr:hypothetical protein [Thermomicrobiales bacterium]
MRVLVGLEHVGEPARAAGLVDSRGALGGALGRSLAHPDGRRGRQQRGYGRQQANQRE